jgi:hypothetical protein
VAERHKAAERDPTVLMEWTVPVEELKSGAYEETRSELPN